MNGNKLLKEFEDYHSEDAKVKVRSDNEQTQSARRASENPFLRKVLKMSSFCKTRDFCDLNESPTSRQVKPPKHSKKKF